MLLSIILITNRPFYCLEEYPTTDWLVLFLNSLAQQIFDLSRVEVVIVDGLYSDRHHLFTDDCTYAGYTYNFKIKHIDQVMDNPFFKRGLWGEAFALNRGIIYADGELLMSCNDCYCFEQNDLLLKAYEYYNAGRFLLTGRKIRVPKIRSKRKCTHDSGEDHRLLHLGSLSIRTMEAPGGWFHAFSFFSMESVLKVNGFNMALDGLYGLIDCDMGLRLERAGYRFIFDSTAIITAYSIFNDFPVKERILKDVPLSLGSWKPNGGMMWYLYNRNIYKANNFYWSVAMIADAWEELRNTFIKYNVLSKMTETEPVEGTSDWELLQWWYNNQVVYDLSILRNNRINKK